MNKNFFIVYSQSLFVYNSISRKISAPFYLFFLFFWGIHFALSAEGIPQVQISDTRQQIDLNGDWSFKKKGEDDWRNINLPSVTDEIGDLFFRRSFEITENARNSQLILVFEGINFASKIKFNEQYISSQSHGFTAIEIPIPHKLIRYSGDNTLEIEVNTKLRNNSIPLRHALLSPLPVRGIFRDIYIEVQPAIAIGPVDIQSELFNRSTTAKIKLLVETVAAQFVRDLMDLDAESLKVICSIRSEKSQNQVLARAQQNFELNDELKNQTNLVVEVPNPTMWSLSSPNLYTVEISIQHGNNQIDQIKKKIGIRKLALSSYSLLLNDAPLQVKGIGFLEDSNRIITSGNALATLQEIKSSGFNTISWHVPPLHHALNLTDSLGILNILNVPLWNVPGGVLADEEFDERVSSLITKIVTLAASHPSVLALSLGQGFDPASDGTQFFLSRQIEQTRENHPFFITAGFRGYDTMLSQIKLDFISFDLTLNSGNDWKGWLAGWLQQGQENPLLFSNISVPYFETKSDSENVSIYEATQAHYLKELIKQIQEEPTMGYVLSSLYDWQLSYPSMLSLKNSGKNLLPIGLATVENVPRMSLNMIQNFNKGTGYQFEFQQTMQEGLDIVFILYGLFIIIFFLYFFRKDHRLRGNFIRILSRPFGFHQELKDGRKIPWFTTLIILFSSISSWGLILGSVFSFLQNHPLFDFLISQLSPLSSVNIVLIYISWYPILGIIGFSLFIAGLITILAFIIKFLSIITGRYLSFRNALTLTYWESCIFIFLLPIAFIFYRLMYVTPIRFLLLLLLIIFLVWYIYKIFLGIRTIFSIKPGLIIALFICIPLILIAVLDILYNQNTGLNAHLVYILHLW